MDLTTAIQTFSSIISIPASIYVVFQMYHSSQELKRFLEHASATRKTYLVLISSLSTPSDRVLLTFDRDNREKPGTFEHLVWDLWKQFEELTRGRLFSSDAYDFCYNPIGELAASEARITHYRSDKPQMVIVIILGLSFMAPMLITQGIGELVGKSTFWHYALAIPVFVVFVPLGAIQCWRYLRRSRQKLLDAIKAHEVIRQYVAILEKMGIIVRQEFTQLKSKRTDCEPSPEPER